jgi:hypothetical protein
MPSNPLPILALAAGAFFLMRKKDEPDAPAADPDPGTPLPGVTPDPGTLPSGVQGTAVTAKHGSSDIPGLGTLPWEVRPTPTGLFTAWIWDPEKGALDPELDTSGTKPHEYPTAQDAMDHILDEIEKINQTVEVVVGVDFSELSDGNNPIYFNPTRPGEVVVVRDAPEEGWTYGQRIPAGSQFDPKDFVNMSGVKFPGDKTHVVVTALQGAVPADDISIHAVPEGGPSNDFRPLVIVGGGSGTGWAPNP